MNGMCILRTLYRRPARSNIGVAFAQSPLSRNPKKLDPQREVASLARARASPLLLPKFIVGRGGCDRKFIFDLLINGCVFSMRLQPH